MRIATFFGAALLAGVACAAPALGQRVRIPTQLPLNAATSDASSRSTWASSYGPLAQNMGAAAPSAGPYGAGPVTGNTYTPSGGYAAPGGNASAFSQPGSTYSPSPNFAPQPPANTVPSYPYQPGVAPSYAPSGPTAQFQGTITAPPPNSWDPYATPGSQAPALMPADPYLPNPPAWCYPQSPSNYVQTMQRFMEEFRLDYVWMPGNGPSELGLHDAELSASFAFPFLRSAQAQPAPLLVSPGFATNWWNGPSPPHGPPPANPDFPPRLYEAYLDTAWNPQFTPNLGAELNFRVGVYSDFSRVTNESLRYQGKGYALVSLSPHFQVKAGVQYLDRRRIKLLPAGGLIWTPNSNMRFDILFPDPKLAWRLNRVDNVDWWFYGRGEYGGDSWTIGNGSGVTETDYNDYRVAIGLEFDTQSRWDGYVEVGYAFEREIFQNGGVQMTPNSTVFVGGGLAY